jgi:hypothetical protein
MKLTEITLDTRLQPRESISKEVIAEYADMLREGAVFPPVLIYDDGEKKYLVDGWHRYFAHKLAGFLEIEVTIRKGGFRDAQFCSFGVNGTNGQPRSIKDKRKALFCMFDDVEWDSMSDREIARHCYVSHTFVSKLRSEYGSSPDKIKVKNAGKEYIVEKKQKDEPEETAQAVDPAEDKVVELATEINALNEELEATQRRLAIAAVQATPEEKTLYSQKLEEMAETIKTLESNLRVVTASRDSFQREASELKKQCFYWEKRAKKAEAMAEKQAAK